MSYKLEKPYTEKQRLDFIVEYSHNKNLFIAETETALCALEANEIVQNDEVIINPNYKTEQAEKYKQLRIVQIKQELAELDTKRIRAMCEPSTCEQSPTKTWLEYYNEQAQVLRAELQNLENTGDVNNDNDIN